MIFINLPNLSLFQAAFDWPLGQIGKIKQKYQKSKTNPSRSKSDANIAASSQRYLKRRSSERHGQSGGAARRKVAFEDQREVPWWNFPMRLMKNSDVSKSTGNLLKKKRTRHSTDPESSKLSLAIIIYNPRSQNTSYLLLHIIAFIMNNIRIVKLD